MAAAEALSHGEDFFGELGEIIVFFKKVKLIITLDRSKQIVAVITATKDAKERHISFRSFKADRILVKKESRFFQLVQVLVFIS